MFGKWGRGTVPKEAKNRILVGYNCAIDEIGALLDAIGDRTDADGVRVELTQIRSTISHSARSLSKDGHGFNQLAQEAEGMEERISQIAEATFGFDEARVSGLLMARDTLEMHAADE